MTKQASKEERIELRITTDLKNRVDNVATLMRMPRAEILRIALEHYCSRVESDDKLKEALELISQYK